jgi:hypothetical protein
MLCYFFHGQYYKDDEVTSHAHVVTQKIDNENDIINGKVNLLSDNKKRSNPFKATHGVLLKVHINKNSKRKNALLKNPQSHNDQLKRITVCVYIRIS